MADGKKSSVEGIVVDVPVSFGDIVVAIDFLVIENPPLEVIIN